MFDFWQVLGAIILCGAAVITFLAILHLSAQWRANESLTEAEAHDLEAAARERMNKITTVRPVGGYIILTDGRDHLQPDGTKKPFLIIEKCLTNSEPAQSVEPPAADVISLRNARRLVDLSIAERGGDAKQLSTYDDDLMDHNAQADGIKYMAKNGWVQSSNKGVLLRDGMTLATLLKMIDLTAAAGRLPPAQKSEAT